MVEVGADRTVTAKLAIELAMCVEVVEKLLQLWTMSNMEDRVMPLEVELIGMGEVEGVLQRLEPQ